MTEQAPLTAAQVVRSAVQYGPAGENPAVVVPPGHTHFHGELFKPALAARMARQEYSNGELNEALKLATHINTAVDKEVVDIRSVSNNRWREGRERLTAVTLQRFSILADRVEAKGYFAQEKPDPAMVLSQVAAEHLVTMAILKQPGSRGQVMRFQPGTYFSSVEITRQVMAFPFDTVARSIHMEALVQLATRKYLIPGFLRLAAEIGANGHESETLMQLYMHDSRNL